MEARMCRSVTRLTRRLRARLLSGCAAGIAGYLWSAPASPDGTNAPLPVFILAGQSNMEGAGTVSELPAELQAPQNDARVVRFWETQFKPLDPPKLGKSFGPEVAFGAEIARELHRPMGMIKLAYGGTSLEKDWNPASQDPRGLYKRLTDYVHAVQVKQPDIKIAGMIWMQGEADAKYYSRTMEQYRDKLEALIDGCRKAFGNEELPFVCGRVNPHGPYDQQVREAQESVRRKNYAWIDCDDLEKCPDQLHYSTQGQLALGRRFAGAMLKLMSEGQPSAGAGTRAGAAK